MKTKISLLFTCLPFLLFNFCSLQSQVVYNFQIDSILNLVSVQSISRMNKELSGDTIATIGGVPQIIPSRYWPTIGNIRAAQYIFEKFQSYGLTAKYMINSTTNVHVYAVKTGTKYPNKKYIIGAHYDDITFDPVVPDTIYGADDNASGVCAVIEAARLLANMNLDYTVIFVAFDEEERIGVPNRGSVAFADSLYFRGDTVLGVLNVDMIGFDNNNDKKAGIITDTNSYDLYNDFLGCNQLYQLGFTFYPIWNANVSDHQSFWDRGYKAITSIEDYYGDFNFYFHTVYDRFDKFNIPYFYKFVKCDIAVLLTWALDYRVSMNHIPLTSSSDTSVRIAKVYIKSPFKIGTGVNAPRLYYKTGNGPFSYVNAFTVIQDTFKFMIPGKPGGTQISYYIALQDSAGTVTVTLPSGGSGINPPGTTPPPKLYNYSIFESFVFFSNTVPKPIPGLYTMDTIHVQQTGTVVDVNVTLNINHTNDGDLFIRLAKVSNISNLSQFNGTGGQNFTNTIFDDSASISITQGTPPYTGRFKPQTPLSVFNGKELSGDWILRIFDKGTGNTGTLINWSLEIISAPSVAVNGISSIIPEKYILHQNYPNPFNPVTSIRFDLPKSLDAKLIVYDILGKEITTLVNENLNAGSYEVDWNATGYPSGVYFYKLETENFINVKKMVLIK